MLAYDTAGTLYVLRVAGGQTVVSKVQGAGQVALGTAVAAMSQAGIGDPADLTTDLAGNPYLAYYDNSPWRTCAVYVNKYVNGAWTAVGGQLAPGTLDASWLRVRVSRQGVPFVAYRDVYAGGYLRVKKFNGTGWDLVGAGTMSSPAVTDIDLAIDTSGVPVVTYTDGNATCVKRFNSAANTWTSLFQYNSYGVYNQLNVEIGTDNQLYFAYRYGSHDFVVKKWQNNAWTDLPTGTINMSTGTHLGFALDRSNTPYLMYHNGRAGVLKFTGSGWQDLGEPGIARRQVLQLDMATTKHGRPIIAYCEAADANYINLVKYNGAGWDSVGPRRFDVINSLEKINVAVDTNDVPYVSYLSTADVPVVKRLVGNNWVPVGNFPPLAFPYSDLDMAMDKTTNLPCIVYRYVNSLFALRFNGATWDTVGGGMLFPGWADFPAIAVDDYGIVWVAFQNDSASFSPYYQAPSVRKFVNNSWTDAGVPLTEFGNYIRLAVGGGTAAIAYFDGNYEPIVRRLNAGNIWEATPALPLLTGHNLDLAVSRNGLIYVAGRNDSGRAAMRRLQGGTWASLPAGPTASAGNLDEVSLALDSNGYAFVAYDAYNLYAKGFEGCVANPALSGASCLGGTVQLVSNDALTHSWTGPGGFASSAQNPSFSATNASVQSGWYRVTVTGNNCSVTDSVQITIHPAAAAPQISTPVSHFCEPDTISLQSIAPAAVHYAWSRNAAALAGADDSLLRVSTSGSYRLRTSDQYGCAAESNNLQLVANPQPQPVLSQSGTTLSTGPFASYQWLFNGQAIAGAVHDTCVATSSGTYAVQVTDGNGCTGTSAALAVAISSNGLSSVATGGISVYPNPVRDKLLIHSARPLHAVLYNSSGSQILSTQVAQEIDLQHLPDGLYLLQLFDERGNSVLKQPLTVAHP